MKLSLKAVLYHINESLCQRHHMSEKSVAIIKLRDVDIPYEVLVSRINSHCSYMVFLAQNMMMMIMMMMMTMMIIDQDTLICACTKISRQES